jgi:hypothetical protein
MTWVGDRLFTAGLHGFITEWDLRTLQPKVSGIVQRRID